MDKMYSIRTYTY